MEPGEVSSLAVGRTLNKTLSVYKILSLLLNVKQVDNSFQRFVDYTEK